MPDGWDDALRFVDDVAALTERLVAEETLLAINTAWPVWSGWSLANNRVSLDGPEDFMLDPPTRPEEQGALVGIAQEVEAANLEVIQNHAAPGQIWIGNAVPYAADVGFSENNGTLIYDEAGRSGGVQGAQRAASEWVGLRR